MVNDTSVIDTINAKILNRDKDQVLVPLHESVQLQVLDRAQVQRHDLVELQALVLGLHQHQPWLVFSF